MKKTLLTLLATTGVLTASSVSENLAYAESYSQQPVLEKMNTKGNIGHITFKVGPGTSQQNYEKLVPVFGVGYQSRLNDSSIFQSTMIEFGGAGKSKTTTKDNIHTHEYEGVFYYPKIMGIHYWNKHSENRLFTAVGSNICTSFFEKSVRDDNIVTERNPQVKYKRENSSQTSLGGSMAVGFEMGQPNEAINTIKLEFDQPIVEIISEGEVSLQGVLTVSYVVGF